MDQTILDERESKEASVVRSILEKIEREVQHSDPSCDFLFGEDDVNYFVKSMSVNGNIDKPQVEGLERKVDCMDIRVQKKLRMLVRNRTAKLKVNFESLENIDLDDEEEEELYKKENYNINQSVDLLPTEEKEIESLNTKIAYKARRLRQLNDFQNSENELNGADERTNGLAKEERGLTSQGNNSEDLQEEFEKEMPLFLRSLQKLKIELQKFFRCK